MPLWEAGGPPTVMDDGRVEPGRSILYYQPFSTTDLLNWKHHTPAYSQNPQALIDLLKSIFQTHQPTWDDCCQLLLTLFSTEHILTEARKWLAGQAPAGTLDPAQKGLLPKLPEALLIGIQEGGKKLTNMSKTVEVTQKPDKTPGDFCERLCEAFWIYTPFNPEAPENMRMVNATFITQSAPDICQKLQKLEGFAGMNATQLLEIASKVYTNRDLQAQREADKRMKPKATLLAAALGHPDLTRRPGPWHKVGRSEHPSPHQARSMRILQRGKIPEKQVPQANGPR
ncbi:LOW QUALITY PROTEIN: hypothetical protein AAY473_026965 [Plecturocebus cupreus]